MSVKAHSQRRIHAYADVFADDPELFMRVIVPALYREAKRTKRMRAALRLENERRWESGYYNARSVEEEQDE